MCLAVGDHIEPSVALVTFMMPMCGHVITVGPRAGMLGGGLEIAAIDCAPYGFSCGASILQFIFRATHSNPALFGFGIFAAYRTATIAMVPFTLRFLARFTTFPFSCAFLTMIGESITGSFVSVKFICRLFLLAVGARFEIRHKNPLLGMWRHVSKMASPARGELMMYNTTVFTILDKAIIP